MERTRIILPQTNPDKVDKYINNYIKRISRTMDYQEALYCKEKKEKIMDISETIFPGVAIILLLTLIIISILAPQNEIFFTGLAFIILIIFATPVIVINFKIYKYNKIVNNYFNLISKQAHQYMMNNSDIFEQNRDKYDCTNGHWLMEIDILREWAQQEGVTFIVDREKTDNSYKDLYIYMYKDGILIDNIHLFSWNYNESDFESLLSTPGALDFSFIDKKFWVTEENLKNFLKARLN